MDAVTNTGILINQKLMREISYHKLFLTKVLHSCEDVNIESVNALLV